MKVLHILDSLNRGGAEMLALDVCRNAAKQNLDLTLVATGGGDLEEDFRCSGADYIRLQRQLPIDPQVVFQLRRAITDAQIQIVHSHQAVEALHAYLATRGTKVKNVLSFHGYAPDRKNRLALQFLVPRMDANIAVSRAFLKEICERENYKTCTNFHVLHNGVDRRRLQPTAETDLRSELSIPKTGTLLGMIGNFYLYDMKDHLTVCRALPQVFSEVPDAHFVFVGARSPATPHFYDDCVTYCQAQGIADRVHFLGRRADVPKVLAALDLFVFSSLQDTFGIAVVEAMLMGVPTVVSDISPLLEVSQEGLYAEVFQRKNPDELARLLIRLIRNPERRRELAAAARRWATEQFSIEAHITKLIDFYTKLLAAQ